MTVSLQEYAAPAAAVPVPSTRRIARPTPDAAPAFTAALVIAGIFFGVFGVWSAVMPLQSAAVAPGVVGVESNRKTVQHLEGGIVAAIKVREGDLVSAGQVLIQLSDVQQRATRNQLLLQVAEQTLINARLQAELGNAEFVPADTGLVDAATWRRMSTDQQRILAGRRSALSSQLAMLDQRIAQSAKEISGLEAQIRSERRQAALILSELKDMRTLLRSGLVPRARVLSLERREAELEGSVQIAEAAIGRHQEAILELRFNGSGMRATHQNDVLEAMRVAEAQLGDLNEKLRVAADSMQRLEIRAPLEGRVVGLQMHTAGGVITPGQPLMDIIPTDEQLIVEARIDPNDIEALRVGQPAQLRILSFNQRVVPPIDGRVVSVAADRLSDLRTGQPYYLVRVAPDPSTRALPPGLKLQPGMSADVVILTGERTLLDYLIAPFTRSLTRALRED